MPAAKGSSSGRLSGSRGGSGSGASSGGGRHAAPRPAVVKKTSPKARLTAEGQRQDAAARKRAKHAKPYKGKRTPFG